MIENKIEKLSELINLSMTGKKKDYAISLLNSIIDKLNNDEALIKRYKAKLVNINFNKFDTFLEKCVFSMQAIGFDKTEIANYDDDALIFIAKNRDKIKKPLTVEYLNNLLKLYMYHEWSTGNKPNNLKDLKNAYTEIEADRK